MNLSDCDVLWTNPSPDASGSIPLGNGETAINIWVDPEGDICFYLARTDAWADMGNLLKLGRFRIRIVEERDRPVFAGDSLRWGLHVHAGICEIQTAFAKAILRVDAHHQAVFLAVESTMRLQAVVYLEMWRTSDRVLAPKENHCLHQGAPYPVVTRADTLLPYGENGWIWFHRNTSSTWRSCLEQQSIEGFAESATDPLMHRTFGGMYGGAGWKRGSVAGSLQSLAPATSLSLAIGSQGGLYPCLEDYISELSSSFGRLPDARQADSRKAHADWWATFWKRSWLWPDGDEAARKVGRGYALQRYISACAGRGNFPIKFNGSLFTVDWRYPEEAFDADYRRWGPGYWHQNTRLAYWPMLTAGDFESMQPYFRMYRQALPLAEYRTRRYFGHEGAYFPETMYFWGAYLEGNYGWPHERTGLDVGTTVNRYIRWHWSSGLEVVYHGTLFYEYTGDENFVRETLLPLADGILGFYAEHYPLDGRGRLRIHPAQAIEQWHEAVNPTPELAGLQRCLENLRRLPEGLTGLERHVFWKRLQQRIPPLPLVSSAGNDLPARFAPAESVSGPPMNQENPELYPVFPYRLHTVQRGDLECAKATFQGRTYTHDIGWAQDGIQAALVGSFRDARDSVVKRLTTPSAYARFPAFWGPGFDWIPDQDQGGSACHALQLMALQVEGHDVCLLPAWPLEWSLEARLALPNGCSLHVRKSEGESPEWDLEGPGHLVDQFRIQAPT